MARSTIIETRKVSAELLIAQKDSFASVPVNLDVADIISERKDSLTATSSAIFENVLPVAQNMLLAVGGAGVRFSSQLGDAGNVLGGNLFNLGAAAGDITSKLLSRCLFLTAAVPFTKAVLFFALLLTAFLISIAAVTSIYYRILQ